MQRLVAFQILHRFLVHGVKLRDFEVIAIGVSEQAEFIIALHYFGVVVPFLDLEELRIHDNLLNEVQRFPHHFLELHLNIDLNVVSDVLVVLLSDARRVDVAFKRVLFVLLQKLADLFQWRFQLQLHEDIAGLNQKLIIFMLEDKLILFLFRRPP